MKQQVIYITGAVPKENFSSFYDYLHGIDFNPYEEKFVNWNKTLGEKLGDDWEYIRTPLGELGYADYYAWKIMFEKVIPYMNEEVNIVATSLGGSFILKYLGENDGILDPQTGKKIKIKKLFLIAPAIQDTPDEKLGSFRFDLEAVYTRVARWCEKIYIYHSKDDSVVPIEQSLKLKTFFIDAIFREFEDKGHFFLEEEIPKLVEDIKN